MVASAKFSRGSDGTALAEPVGSTLSDRLPPSAVGRIAAGSSTADSGGVTSGVRRGRVRRWCVLGGGALQGAVEDGDRAPGEKHTVAANGGADRARAGGHLQSGQRVPAHAPPPFPTDPRIPPAAAPPPP